MGKAIQFTRKDLSDGAIETLTLVRLDSGGLAVQIETGTPAERGDFMGLYDLDGDQIQTAGESWELDEADKLTGREAIRAADLSEATLRAYADEIDPQDREVSVEQAKEIAEQDPNLIYMRVEDLFQSWERGGTVVERWMSADSAVEHR